MPEEAAEPSDFDIAIIDSLKALIEVIASKNVASLEEFAIPLRHQYAAARAGKNPVGAHVFAELLKFCETRGPFHTLYKAPPAGSA